LTSKERYDIIEKLSGKGKKEAKEKAVWKRDGGGH